MRVGHIIALVGAILALVGGTALDWQHFELADVTAKGFEVPLAGQAVLVLAALAALASLLGLVTRRRYQFAGVSLVAALFSFGWLVFAHMGKLDAFQLMPFESIEMLNGYSLAVWGALLTFIGPLVVLASEPAWDPKSQFLRVALLWKDTVIQEKVLQEAATFTIGDDLRNDFIVPEDKLPKKFPLFRAGRRGQYAIGLSRELEGQVTINQQTMAIKDYVKSSTDNVSGVNYVPISKGDWGMLEMGEMRVFFQFVSPEARRRRTGLVAFEETVWSSISISFFAQATFVILGVLLWNETFTRGVFVEQKREPDIEAAVMKMDEPDTPELEEDAEDEDVSKKAGGEEGKFGDPDEDPDKKNKIPHLDAKMVDKIDVKKVGLNDLLSTNKLGGTGAISEILNANNNGMSNKIAVAMGGEGSDFQVGYGAGGMGFQGDGTGGGGDGVGRIMGQGDIDTGGGPGIRAGMGKKGKARVGKLNVGSGMSKGFCKQSQIASVVKRRAGAIRACYEQRLQVKKDLKGKLTVRWTIKLDGSVAGVDAVGDTLGDSATTNCIFRHLRRMRFQKPDGGICVVQWPFVFSPG
ncbi:MAG: hypothetical protein EP329_01655 [Deltaproteobacteria bacterium]|nr:MAG: hypothetical protein EP329_01655 [Deltaproteobacteria bacterium]